MSKTCEQCGAEIPRGARYHARYCSPACRQRAYRRRQGVRPRHLSDGVTRDRA